MISRKIAVVIIYFLLWMGCFQLKEVILIHDNESLQTLFFCLLAGILFAYTNGFQIFRIQSKSHPNKPEDDSFEKK